MSLSENINKSRDLKENVIEIVVLKTRFFTNLCLQENVYFESLCVFLSHLGNHVALKFRKQWLVSKLLILLRSYEILVHNPNSPVLIFANYGPLLR